MTLVLMMTVGFPNVAGQTTFWENRGQAELFGNALDLAGGGRVIVAAGDVGDEFSARQWFVRGIDQQTGTTKWEDRFGPLTDGVAKDAAVVGQRAFVAGWIFTPGLGYEFVVRAYDLRGGVELWSRQVNRGPQCVEESPGFARCVAKALTVHDGRVFVVGHLTRTGTRQDFSVLAFDAATGATLWDSVTDSTGTGADDYAWAVAAAGDRLFVLGEIGMSPACCSRLTMRKQALFTGSSGCLAPAITRSRRRWRRTDTLY